MSDEHDDDDETLPFDVEVERLPAWVHVSSALVIIVGILVATKLVHMLVFLPFLATSSIGRRFASSATHIEVDDAGLELGGREIARSEIVDVWIDDAKSEPRVTIATGEQVELAILHFENREQAERFAGALAPEGAAERRCAVAGYLPRPVDWLSSLRFVAVAAAFFGTGSSLGALVLGIFGYGAWNILRARQVVARADRVELRSVLGVTAHTYSEIDRVDLDDGIIRLKGGAEISVPRSAIRDTMLGSGPWLERARTRVFRQIASAVRRT